jgi:amidase
VARAEFLDNWIAENNKPLGTLHGLPVSLKDQFHVKGCDTTMGYVGWVDTFEGANDPKKVHQVESQIVKDILSQGGIIYCKVTTLSMLRVSEQS